MNKGIKGKCATRTFIENALPPDNRKRQASELMLFLNYHGVRKIWRGQEEAACLTHDIELPCAQIAANPCATKQILI